MAEIAGIGSFIRDYGALGLFIVLGGLLIRGDIVVGWIYRERKEEMVKLLASMERLTQAVERQQRRRAP
jgi:hypothetical protein